ncbi:hypothetical protein [Microbacterium sp.]|uniref:hypothetical protein n=1 Tax=Microbacterium sp. TaxID=51671 RepID=UPI0037354EBF
MTDEKTNPDYPEDAVSAGDDLNDTVVREPDTTVDEYAASAVPADENATQAFAPDAFSDAFTPDPMAEPVESHAASDAVVADPVADEPWHDEEPVLAAAPLDESHEATGGVPPQYGIGPFSLREVVLGGVWALAFLFSFFPLYVDDRYNDVFGGATVWTSGIDWILSIGVPTVAVFLLALRRFSPDGIRRVGSLGIDQFASVAFSVAAVVWVGWLWNNIARGATSGFWLSSWVVWAEAILFLAAVALTVFAPFIPPFHEDFLHRDEKVAHRVARRARPVVARPISDARFTMAAPSVDPEPAPLGDPIDDDEPAPVAASTHQAFWALVPADRDVVDENGIPLFRIGPTAWALVIEDRGDSFVVRHEDGRIGFLTDVSGVTRG